jgi:multidrug efflux pump subunit AcrB
LADLLLKGEHEANHGTEAGSRKLSAFGRLHASFNRGFERFQNAYAGVLLWCLQNRGTAITAFVLFFASAFGAAYFVGRDFYPPVGGSEIRLHLRAPAGTRVERTEIYADRLEDAVRRVIPKEKLASILTNTGLPGGGYGFLFVEGSSFGPADTDLTLSLTEGENANEWMKVLRKKLPDQFPDCQVFMEPADMVTRILNFGLQSPIDVQIVGYDRKNNLAVAGELRQKMARIPGLFDVHLHQVIDAPELFVKVDRERAYQLGLTEQKLASAVNVALSGSGQVTPVFWTDPITGFLYDVQVQMPPYRFTNMSELLRLPVNNVNGTPILLSNVATVSRKPTMEVVNHFNQLPSFNLYAQPDGRDLGSIAKELEPMVAEASAKLKPGNRIELRGQILSMESAFTALGIGLVFAAVLVYLLMVVNFQSFVLPLIIITALPGAFGGIVWILFLTGNTFNIPSLMGAIMSVGVATANSILLVTFAKDQYQHTHRGDALAAALDAGRTRLRPILMTALAMIMGMLPMSLALGHGSHQNAPLGVAVIGGLLMATVTTLLFVPMVFSLLAHRVTLDQEEL